MNVFQETIASIRRALGRLAECLSDECDRHISANEDLSKFKKINMLLNVLYAKNMNISFEDIMRYKYAPEVSVEVEKSFSGLQYINSDRQHTLTLDN